MKKRDMLIGLILAISIGSIAAGIAYDTKAPVKATETTKTAVKPVETKPKPVYVAPVPKVSDIIAGTNEYRATKGLTPLAENALLTQSACAKAQHMIDNGYWGHDAPDGTEWWYWFDQSGYNYAQAGENLAWGYHTGSEVNTGWINSPGHEANLSGDYLEVGVCVKEGVVKLTDTSDGSIKLTHDLVVAHYGKQL